MRSIYIHQRGHWPRFHWDAAIIAELLASTRHRQGHLLGRMEGLGFNLQQSERLLRK